MPVPRGFPFSELPIKPVRFFFFHLMKRPIPHSAFDKNFYEQIESYPRIIYRNERKKLTFCVIAASEANRKPNELLRLAFDISITQELKTRRTSEGTQTQHGFRLGVTVVQTAASSLASLSRFSSSTRRATASSPEEPHPGGFPSTSSRSTGATFPRKFHSERTKGQRGSHRRRSLFILETSLENGPGKNRRNSTSDR